MKVLSIIQTDIYTSLKNFVETHKLEAVIVETRLGCTIDEYINADYSDCEGIEKLLPLVYPNTNDIFTLYTNNSEGVIDLIRLKMPKEVFGFNIQDVHSRVDDMNETIEEQGGIPVDINDEEAEKVLDIVEKCADCGNGISWDDIDDAIDKYLTLVTK